MEHPRIARQPCLLERLDVEVGPEFGDPRLERDEVTARVQEALPDTGLQQCRVLAAQETSVRDGENVASNSSAIRRRSRAASRPISSARPAITGQMPSRSTS